MDMKVCCLNVEDYNVQNLEIRVEELFRKLKVDEALQLKGKKVLLKPNLVSPLAPEKAVTTHPAVIEAIITCLEKRGVDEVGVGDSGLHGTPDIFTKTGITDVVDKKGAKICDFDRYDLIYRMNNGSSTLESIPLTKYLEDFDIIINVPKLKIHHAFVYTGAVKNIYGTIPGKNKLQIHAKAGNVDRFEDMLVDIYESVRPHLTIIDGIVGLEGNGPCNGTPVQTGLLMGSMNALALDMIACQKIGIDYKKVGYLNKYWKKSERLEVTEITYIGDDAEVVQYDKPNLLFSVLPKLVERFLPILYIFIKPIPKFNSKCSKCNICVKKCPVQALEMSHPYPKVSKKECISCFCCQEACFNDAIVRSDAR